MFIPAFLYPYLFLTLFVLLLLETIWLIRLSMHYNRLTKGVDKSSLMAVLESLQKTLGVHESRISKLDTKLADLTLSSRSHLQRLVVKRFNPFSDTGGDQSFILGLFDAEMNGVMITSLHSRENTRFYVKSVSGGEGSPYPLSDEEKKVLKKG